MGRVRNLTEFGGRHGLHIDSANAWHMDLLTIAVLLMICLFAEVTWRLVERPGQALGAGVVGWLQRGARPA